MKLVGLTGGIATGKSTVSRWLREECLVPVIDADLVARQVVEPPSATLMALVAAFGPEILAADGRLDRPSMRARIITDEPSRKTLDAIMHPAIGRAVAERIARLRDEGHGVAVVEAALMIETGSYRLYDAVIVVSCSPETQLSRLMSRDGMQERAAAALIATQRPLAEKEALADVVLRNDGTTEELHAAFRNALDNEPLRKWFGGKVAGH